MFSVDNNGAANNYGLCTQPLNGRYGGLSDYKNKEMSRQIVVVGFWLVRSLAPIRL